MDFDKRGWQQDALAVLDACNSLGIPGALERSRSGQGAHLWIFFSGPIKASFARNLGSLVLTRALDRRYQIGFGSYDRLLKRLKSNNVPLAKVYIQQAPETTEPLILVHGPGYVPG